MLPFRAADEPLPERALLPVQLLLLPSGQGSSPRQIQLLPRQLDDFGRLKAQPNSEEICLKTVIKGTIIILLPHNMPMNTRLIPKI